MKRKIYSNAVGLTGLCIVALIILVVNACSQKVQKSIDYAEAERISQTTLAKCANSDRLKVDQFVLVRVETNEEARDERGKIISEYFPWVFRYESNTKPKCIILIYVKETGEVEASGWFSD